MVLAIAVLLIAVVMSWLAVAARRTRPREPQGFVRRGREIEHRSVTILHLGAQADRPKAS
jgi:hypothetical protein